MTTEKVKRKRRRDNSIEAKARAIVKMVGRENLPEVIRILSFAQSMIEQNPGVEKRVRAVEPDSRVD